MLLILIINLIACISGLIMCCFSKKIVYSKKTTKKALDSFKKRINSNKK